MSSAKVVSVPSGKIVIFGGGVPLYGKNGDIIGGLGVSGGSEEQVQAAAKFAAGLGLAFQIRDDMLDVIGSQEEMGKGVGTDANKNTFVRLYGLEKCEELVQTYTDYALQALNVFEDTKFITELARSLTARRT